jgi:hypothetical protein
MARNEVADPQAEEGSAYGHRHRVRQALDATCLGGSHSSDPPVP